MDVNESVREAERILHAAGWQEAPGWQGYTHGPCVGGVAPDGTLYVKSIQMVKEGDPRYGPDTPDEHHEAAAWLVEHAKARAPQDDSPAAADTMMLAQEEEPAETPQHESDGETGEEAAADEWAEPNLDGVQLRSDGPEERDAVLEPSFTDADFEAIEELGAQDELAETDFETLAIEGADAEPEAPAQDGPIAYGASTIDGLIREKLGRVSQIARELKAVLQEGWTVEEYAYLQNLMVRMDRGEAPDDQASRERFLAIAAKSQAMSRIDAVRDRKEGELEEIGQRRDFDAAVYYEPGEGWPA